MRRSDDSEGRSVRDGRRAARGPAARAIVVRGAALRSVAAIVLAAAGRSATGAAVQVGAPPTTTDDPRPHVVVGGFELAPGADPRDGWLVGALEETLTWRLRRVTGLLATPTARLAQARRDVEADGAAAAPLERLAVLLGAEHCVTGVCTVGPGGGLRLELRVFAPASLGTDSGAPRTPGAESGPLDAPGLFELLDRATEWLLAHFGRGDVEADARELIFAPPCRSPSALEYYVRALQAARTDNVRDVMHYLGEALDYDPMYREALNMRARLALNGGAATQLEAARIIRQLAELARRARDPLDRIGVELDRGIVAATTQGPEAALDQFELGLTLAYERDDPYAQLAAVAHICDLLAAMQPPAEIGDVERRARLLRGQLGRAARWQRVHLELAARIGDLLAQIPSAGRLADILEGIEDWDEALTVRRGGLALAQRAGLQSAEAAAWLALGRHFGLRDRRSEALDALSRALALCRERERPVVRAALAEAYDAMQMPVEALGQLELAYEQIRTGDSLTAQFGCLRRIAELRRRLGRTDQALRALQEALDIAHALRLPESDELRRTLDEWRSASP